MRGSVTEIVYRHASAAWTTGTLRSTVQGRTEASSASGAAIQTISLKLAQNHHSAVYAGNQGTLMGPLNTPQDESSGGEPRQPTELRIMQINVGRCRQAHDLLFATAAKKGASLLLVSEPNTRVGRGWKFDQRKDVAIKAINNITPTSSGDGTAFAWSEVEGVVFYSCYFSPNREIQAFEEFLFELWFA